MPDTPTIDALGTRWWIEIFDDISEEKRTAAISGCAFLLSEFEQRYSRFKDSSLISELNRIGRVDTPPPQFFELLTHGVKLYDRSNGIFNIMIGEKLNAHGYDSNYSFTAQEFTTTVPSPHDALTITKEHITLHNGQIDIGGYGKGYVIDLIADYLKNHEQLSYFLINGGGDMYATSDHDRPLVVYLEHPTLTGTYIETTTIHNQGFAASSPHKRTWKSSDKSYTHIITQNDETFQADATFIKAESACDADVFATVALIMKASEFGLIASKEKLGVARFTVRDNLLERNTAFD